MILFAILPPLPVAPNVTSIPPSITPMMSVISDHMITDVADAPAYSLKDALKKCYLKKLSAWIKSEYDRINDTTPHLNWRADAYSLATGLDYKFRHNFTAGMAFVHTYLEGKTHYNDGVLKENTYGLVPYIHLKANDWFSMDFSTAYTLVENYYDYKYHADHTVLTSTAKPRGKRWYVDGFMNFTKILKEIYLQARLGAMYTINKLDGYTESNHQNYEASKLNVTTLFTRFQAGYDLFKDYETYGFVTFSHDRMRFSQSHEDSYAPLHKHRHGWGGGGGLNLKLHHCLVGGIEYKYNRNKNIKIHGITAKINYLF